LVGTDRHQPSFLSLAAPPSFARDADAVTLMRAKHRDIHASGGLAACAAAVIQTSAKPIANSFRDYIKREYLPALCDAHRWCFTEDLLSIEDDAR
jgi:hypothetical protein